MKDGEYFLNVGHFSGIDVYKHTPKEVIFTTRSEIWMRSVERVQKMIDVIDEEEKTKKKIPFARFGKKSVIKINDKLKGGETNCLDWARKKLLIAGIKLETSDLEEIAAGKKIAAKIDQLYNDNDKNLDDKWFITRILCYLRDNFVDAGYHPRFYWKFENKSFDYYTADDFKKEFHREPTKKNEVSSTWYIDADARIVLYRAP